jgi:hypothetical protein
MAGPQEGEEYIDRLQQVRSRYSVQWPAFSTDGIPGYTHYSPIRKLLFVTKHGGTSGAMIGVLDELLTISIWSLMELQPHIAEKMDSDLTMRIGGRFKLIENFSENLLYLPQLSEHQSLLTQQFTGVS